MGYHSPGRRSRPGHRIGTVEIVCILFVLVAVAALIAWIVTTAGGGHMMF